jgi:serine/threonine-protein kinase GIN4
MGRTPFEYAETEEFASKEDMERYWGRTVSYSHSYPCVRLAVIGIDRRFIYLIPIQLRGKWVGSWKMSKGMEKLLRRMITPNADLRCNAADAMADPYWSGRVEPASHSMFSFLQFENTC